MGAILSIIRAVNRSVDTFNNFIRGRWAPARGGATFGDENPAHRGSNLGAFQASTADDVREAIDAAAGAFQSWRKTSVAERQRYVAAFLNLLRDSREDSFEFCWDGFEIATSSARARLERKGDPSNAR